MEAFIDFTIQSHYGTLLGRPAFPAPYKMFGVSDQLKERVKPWDYSYLQSIPVIRFKGRYFPIRVDHQPIISKPGKRVPFGLGEILP